MDAPEFMTRSRDWWTPDAQERLTHIGKKLLATLTLSDSPLLDSKTKAMGQSIRLLSQGLLPLLQDAFSSDNADLPMFVETTSDFLRFVVTGDTNDTVEELRALTVNEDDWQRAFTPVTGDQAAVSAFTNQMRDMGLSDDEIEATMMQAMKDPRLAKMLVESAPGMPT